jgi:hypothetical protein
MALPSSGQISIDDIRDEFGISSGSLGYLSDLAGFSAPDAMSDFYNYNAYSVVVSGVSPSGPCAPANYNIYENEGTNLYYASDDGGSTYSLAYSIDAYWYLYAYYDSFFDAYVYDYYEVNAASSTFTYQGQTLSYCAPS